MQKQKTKGAPRDKMQLAIFGIIAVAVVVAVAAILIQATGFNPGDVEIDYSDMPQERLADGGFVVGDPNAPVTIVVFEDFLCGHCQSYQSDIKQFIRDNVKTGLARLEFRMMSTASGTNPLLFQLAECSETLQPGTFWPAHDLLFDMASRGWRMDSSPRDFASRMNLDYNRLLDCQPNARQYATDTRLAQTLGITGTPTLMVRTGNSQPRFEPSLGPRPNAASLAAFVAAQQ
ncbi:MAG: DsbA family protein [Anaerolineae bacterium]|nr:DsbA family protein [Anaerolineae bacterium]MDW8173215.1 thioredoxin domain-containing protein [Anaerolineae bacterium]